MSMDMIERGEDLLNQKINRGTNNRIKEYLEALNRLPPEEHRRYGKELRDITKKICDKMKANWPDKQANPRLVELLISLDCYGGEDVGGGGEGGSGKDKLKKTYPNPYKYQHNIDIKKLNS